ncbi:MAG TPA: hypothetical protein VLU25_22420 [Acidobacteriota bacterium]|nr:hypothetical protein [Acidobacteriota bacterium]
MNRPRLTVLIVFLVVLCLMLGLVIYRQYQGVQWETTEREAVGPARGGFSAQDSTEAGTTDSERRSSKEARFLPGQARRARYVFSFRGNRSFAANVLASSIALPFEMPEEQELAKLVSAGLDTFYDRHGYLDFQLTEIDISLGAPVHISCQITEGPQYTFGSISLLAEDEEIVRALEEASKPGMPADVARLRSVLSEMARSHRDQGFLDFRRGIEVAKNRSTASFEFDIVVERGPRYKVGEVIFPPELPELLPLRSLKGQPFNKSLIEFYLDQAELSWDAVSLEKDFWDETVKISINAPSQ